MAFFLCEDLSFQSEPCKVKSNKNKKIVIQDNSLSHLYFMNKWIDKVGDWLRDKAALAPLPERDVFELCAFVFDVVGNIIDRQKKYLFANRMLNMLKDLLLLLVTFMGSTRT